MHFIFNLITAIITVLFQQGIVIGFGYIVYAQSKPIWGIVVWPLAIPMLYLNYKTWQGIMNYGLFYSSLLIKTPQKLM